MKQIYKFDSNNIEKSAKIEKNVFFFFFLSERNNSVETIWKFSWTYWKIHGFDHRCSSNKPQSEIINFRGYAKRSFQTRHDLKRYTGKPEQT